MSKRGDPQIQRLNLYGPEPERAHRWVVLLFGAVVAFSLQGAGLFAAYNYEAPKEARRAL